MTSFGESHGWGMGVLIEGCPAGVNFKHDILKNFMARRRPGSSSLVSGRNEPDEPQVVSGIYEDKTLGTPIAVFVKNENQKSEDYKFIQEGAVRPGHADDVWKNKFGHSDGRGGGRASGRETISRVIAGSFAKMFVQQIYPQSDVEAALVSVGELDANDKDFTSQLEDLLLKAKADGKSYGGVAEISIKNPPANLGEPVFLKFKSELAKAFMSVGATVGVELGEGFGSTAREGTEFHSGNPSVYGGIRGGITTGEDIKFRIAVKPTSSVMGVAKKGRHDPSIVLRALVVFESMSWLVLADQILMSRLNKV